MGLKRQNAEKFKTDADKTGAPWYLPSGTYECRGFCVSITAIEGKKKPLAMVSVRPCNAEQLKKAGCPNPADPPTLTDKFDLNNPEDEATFLGIVGQPHKDGSTVTWGPEGLFQWNGKTDNDCNLVGECDVTVSSKAPNPKNDGKGWWDARITVDDWSRSGEAQSEQQKMLSSIFDSDDSADDAEETDGDVFDQAIADKTTKPKGGATPKKK